ncbi:MAG: hypothetical protein H0U28_01375, partial [Nocardioidaceae bacterium]|nr:hypothetical protein [Nocardioidaceae bacterium]
MAAVLAGCSKQDSEQVGRLALPEPASDRAMYTKDLWGGAWLAAAVVGVFVWGLIIWVVVRYRRRSEDEVPTQTRYNLPIEVLYTIAPLIIIAVLFYFTVDVQRAVTVGAYRSNPALAGQSIDATAAAGGEGHLIQVVGQKWA